MSENQNANVVQHKKSTMTKVTEKLGQVSLVAGTAIVASPAFAALDVSPLETEIASNGTSVQTIMLAVLTLIALFVGYRLIKRAMS